MVNYFVIWRTSCIVNELLTLNFFLFGVFFYLRLLRVRVPVLTTPYSNKDCRRRGMQVGVNKLPRVVTQLRSDRGSNHRPFDPKSDALQLRHDATHYPTTYVVPETYTSNCGMEMNCCENGIRFSDRVWNGNEMLNTCQWEWQFSDGNGGKVSIIGIPAQL